MSVTLFLHRRAVPALGFLILLAACEEPSRPAGPDLGPSVYGDEDVIADGQTIRHYGAPIRLGHGIARTHVLVNSADRDVPLEVGVALSEGAMDGLPAVRGTAEQSMVMNLVALGHASDRAVARVEGALAKGPEALANLSAEASGHAQGEAGIGANGAGLQVGADAGTRVELGGA
jgi:hypothetical protein